ncbi:MAG: hypothetical protein ACXADB_06425 [Candidatus Hermodarchaeia archaeon]|jgi:hypothetical protein
MKTNAIKILGMILLLSMAIPAVYARGPSGKAGKSDIQQLYLVQKDPADWSIVEDGAWGKMTYNVATGKFVFNGHGLTVGWNYTLINFARVDNIWPATINGLGSGIVDEDGNVHIAGNYAYDDLDYDETTDTGSFDGFKIWLVMGADLTGLTLSGWNPEQYLFEDDLI